MPQRRKIKDFRFISIPGFPSKMPGPMKKPIFWSQRSVVRRGSSNITSTWPIAAGMDGSGSTAVLATRANLTPIAITCFRFLPAWRSTTSAGLISGALTAGFRQILMNMAGVRRSIPYFIVTGNRFIPRSSWRRWRKPVPSMNTFAC
ncbi:hypothetical protein SDC9_115343 [bioreactor metagenome]|uniref:Uncharacterized protein n=1 Tax=bioreactor metagenome TaxID=1076179 RepID=A0A645BUW3_9ZZZZ